MIKPILIAFFIIALIVSGAWFVTDYFKPVPVVNVNLNAVGDGTFIGTCEHGFFTYEVRITVLNHIISSIAVVKNRDDSFAIKAEAVIDRILQKQSLNVDAVSGATTASSVLLKSVENALISGKTL
jgi:uncharacterized protein with FMN-binding domain